jgi:transposase
MKLSASEAQLQIRKRRIKLKDKTKLFDIVLIAIIVLTVLFVFRVASPHSLAASSKPAPTRAPDPQQFPVMDAIANKIVQKYQSSTCEQLWQERAQAKNKPKSTQEQEAIGILRNDAQMRAAFINKIAAPIANKMFECGMIP